ncbi:Tat pathway signal protein [Kribbella steppae]|uniref:Tat pathway signal protein n=1 Tax=Kribbella steppae TaxID=2512223 RepID=UPI00130EFD6D|nr:Tat pathway signal protein [Kribbella steppae]
MADGVVDRLTFGDSASESAHGLAAPFSTVVTGALDQSARIAKPLSPVANHLGDLRFVAEVAPAAQNYLSLKFWGEDVSPYRTVVYVDGAQANYRNSGDYEPINLGTGKALPGRFFIATTMLPLASTKGRTQVEIILRTFNNAMTGNASNDSRGYYAAAVHTQPKVDLGETGTQPAPKTAPALTPEQGQATIDGLRTTQVNLFTTLAAKSDAAPNATLSITRYQDELRYYAEVLSTEWSPAKTPDEKRAALERIFKSVDNFTKQYYGNVKSLGNGGHQSDWGGYYGALGEALYIVDNLIADDSIYGSTQFTSFLAEPFVTGTVDGPNSIAGVDWTGGQLTRGEAWERVLKANYDFARSRLSYIYNQMMYTYEGAWKAHEGLRVIGSRFYEGKQRSYRIAGEALGFEPFLGEEVLVGPDGANLDLYHSLFQHDQNAVYTDDYLQIVMKGLAKSKLDASGNVVRRTPYGVHYYGVTRDGQTRENGYVGSYGESTNYLTSWFFRTLGHAGDEKLNDEILKLALRVLHARGQTRHQGRDANGNRVMYMEQVVDDRTVQYPGKIAYAADTGTGRGLAFASLEHYMAQHKAKYSGLAWTQYWRYATEAVGYTQQQLVDNQYFPYFSSVLSNHKYDLRIAETYAYLTKERGPAGVVLPHTDLDLFTDDELARLGVSRDDEKRTAWVDVDNMFVSVHDGDVDLLGNLIERNKGYLGNGRLHAQYGDHEQLVQLQTQGVFESKEYYLRAASDEDPMFHDRYTDADRPLAMAGELLPITYQPGVGTINRDNWVQDNPYSGYPNLLTAQYGKYFFAINSTRRAYGNEHTYPVRLPAGFNGTQVRDLVSGRDLPVVHGVVVLQPTRGVVLDLGTEEVRPDDPSAVDVAVTTPGTKAVGLTWRDAAGATSYTIGRSVSQNGPFVAVATDVRSTSYVDKVPGDGTYYYRVTPVNAQGAGRGAEAKAVVKPSWLNDRWRADTIGAGAAGKVSAKDGAITVTEAGGNGFGGGDDSVIYDRWSKDSLTMVSRLAQGGTAVSAKLGDGTTRGVILRDSTAPTARYAFLGADATGALTLKFRALDSRADIGTGTAGQNAAGGVTRSPFVQQLKGYTVADYPYVKLVRMPQSDRVLAFLSKDGQQWSQVGEASVPMVDVVNAGVAADRSGSFTQVSVVPVAPDLVVAWGKFLDRDGLVTWTKPKEAIAFDLYRSRDRVSWEKLLDNVYATSFTDTVYGGRMSYRVVARKVDGRTSTSEPAYLDADSFATVLQKARAVPADDYTSASFAQFKAEVDAAEAASSDPEETRIKRVYDAYPLLVPVYKHSFEPNEADIWSPAGTGPYVRTIAEDYARTGTRSLYFTSTDTTANGSYNLLFHSRKQGVSPFKAKPGTTYKVSFWYQLQDYKPGAGLGAYYFVSSRSGGSQLGTEQRNWLPAGDTAAGQWKSFERTYTTVGDASVDNISIDLGFRGAFGTFRVDDVRVEPV